MSIIEEAAKRLEQLRKAGVDAVEEPIPAIPVTAPISASVSETIQRPVRSRPQAAQGAAESSRRVEIDMLSIKSRGIVTPWDPRTQVADEFRIIKRPLIANAKGKSAAPIQNANLIMVTSAMPGEGKTFTSINLAMSIAMELDSTVLLVDADVSRPAVLNTLGLQPAKGLLDVLTNDAVELGSVLLKTNVEKLSLLPSGSPHPRATELLASDAMNALLVEMANRYSDRIIIFDSPPLLVATESPVLAT
ncbi:MAG: XrtA-associated tyrosine autokinase, partial [Nitrospira sp.]|nr:XrtA-associated tyrosine autokinase [Nitrospira sp.]